MKKMFAVIAAAVALFINTSAHAANHVGRCVTQKAKVGKDGRLVPVKQIVVKASPQDKAGTTPALPMAMTVKAEQGDLVQLADPENSKVIGWVIFKDLEMQALRNCNL